MPALYTVVDELQGAFALLEETDGELTPEIMEKIEDAKVNFATKVESVALYIQGKIHQTEVVTTEVKRLTDRLVTQQNEIDRLKKYLLDQLRRAEQKKVATPLISVWRQNSVASVQIIDEKDIPARFKTGRLNLPMMEIPETLIERAEIAVNRSAIREAIKEGEQVPGAEMGEPTEFVRIK